MCLILDTNKYSEFLDPRNEDMQPVRDWLRKHGKIVYSSTEQIEAELNNHQRMKRRIFEYRQAGRIKIIDEGKVDKAAAKLTGLLSNDAHIIALAIASETKLLVSGDKNLHADFRKKAGGKVYQNKNHKHLLQPDTCP